MNHIDTMKQALDALELLARYENPETKIQVRKPKDGGPIVTMYPHKVATEAAQSLRLAIEQAEKQEPVAWEPKIETQYQDGFVVSQRIKRTPDGPWEDYIAPPQRQPLQVCQAECNEQARLLGMSAERELRLRAITAQLLEALELAEAGLADIGDADREPGDDLAWCERRAAEPLPVIRAAIAAAKEQA